MAQRSASASLRMVRSAIPFSEIARFCAGKRHCANNRQDAIPGEFNVPERCEAKLWQEQDESERVDWLLSKQLDVIILAWWPYLLKGGILDAAPVILNTDPSLLPYCRGKDPNFWAIVESAPFGVTLHHVNTAIDAGEIAFQKEIPVCWSDTGGTLYQKALTEMVELFDEALPVIVHGEIPRTSQSDVGSLHYRKQLEPASVIDLDAPTTARKVLNRLRARTFLRILRAALPTARTFTRPGSPSIRLPRPTGRHLRVIDSDRPDALIHRESPGRLVRLGAAPHR